MKFNIPKVEVPQFYIDTALTRGRKAASKQKDQKQREIERIKHINIYLKKTLQNILLSFPNTTELDRFHLEMIKCTMSYVKFKKSLGAVNWAKQQIKRFSKKYSSKIKRGRASKKLTGAYIGRVSSILKQIKTELKFLDEARKILKTFPDIKQGFFTVALFGFPNVGKTTLLSKITSSKPEIAPYPFTTRGINMGYAQKKHQKIQFLDTPGTLNRFQKMNSIEKQAYLAIHNIADKIVYVFDLTESFPLSEQMQLYSNIKSKKPLVYLSKTDIMKPEKYIDFKKKYSAFTNPEKLKNHLFSLI
ncbi:MAG: GTPase Obg [Candidatus Woesearchaeota archaeon]|nr:GTPase Obg [Candidatus Woesearchaeota archaeon]